MRREELKQARYAFSDNDVKQYFTEPQVLGGLFRIIETLFEVQIKPDSAPTWHPDVRFFRIERGDTRHSWSASSTSIPTPVRASAPVPGWTMCAAAGPGPMA